MTPTALRRLLAAATVAGVLLTGAACGSEDEPTPTDKSSQMTDEMTDEVSESPMTEKSDDMMDEKSESPMDDMSDDMTDDMTEK